MFIDHFLDKINKLYINTNIERINILVCITSNHRNNFDEILFIEILRNIREIFPGNITIFEKKFKDSSFSNLSQNIINIFKELRIGHCYIEINNLQQVEVKKNEHNVFSFFYVNKSFWKSDLKLILAKASLHKHHAFLYPFTCLEELALSVSLSTTDFTRFNRLEVIQILRSDMIYIYTDLLRTFPNNKFIGILDARNSKITYEHIPFYSRVNDFGIIVDNNLFKIKEHFLSYYQ